MEAIAHTGRRVLLVLALAALALLVSGCGGAEVQEPESGSTEPAEDTGEPALEPEAGEELSLRESVGQMFMVGMGGTEPDYYIEKMVRERNIGGVILFAHNMESREQTGATVSALQRLALRTEPGIPMLVAVDHEGGIVSHAPWVDEEPSAMAVGQSGDPQQARRVSERIGRQLREAGVNTDLAPVVDTGFGAAIGERSYGADPQLVARMGAAAVRGFEAAGVVSSAKHFPNHGPADTDSHVGQPVIEHDLETIRTQDLPPFRAAIEAGVPMVMVGHLIYPAIDPEHPASVSPEAYRLLREELGFDGVIITDDLNMDGVKRDGTVADAAVDAVSAGADMLIVGATPEEQAEAYRAVLAAVEAGEIPREQIDASVERIMQLKDSYELYQE
jgi:beta-N-acetylhexosaminidase